MMKNKVKNILLILLSIICVISMIPINCFADASNSTNTVTATFKGDCVYGVRYLIIDDADETEISANEDNTYTLTPGVKYAYGFYADKDKKSLGTLAFTCEEESGTYIISGDAASGFTYTFEAAKTSGKKYMLTTDTEESTYGKVSFVSSSVKSGKKATVTISLGNGYAVESCTAFKTGDPETKVEMTKDSTSTSTQEKYTFTMPAYDVTVNATFKKQEYAITFADNILNGTLETSGKVAEDGTVTAAFGDTVTITAKPDAGFSLFDVKAYMTGAAKYASVEKSADDKNVFTFTMPSNAVKLEATFGVASSDAESDTSAAVVKGGSEITSGGTYTIEAGATGVITVKTSDPVILQGNGVSSADKYTSLSIDCTSQASDITLRNVYISNPVSGKNVIDFNNGQKNSLKIEGTNILDLDTNAAGYACIHVPTGSTLEMDGPGVLYLYKREQGAGIGGDCVNEGGESNGTLYFGKNEPLTLFSKGTKQGATIGNGANCSDKPGDIYFYSGEYSMIANSRGAIIGGSAGKESESGGNVYIYGGVFNFNVDFSGAAIGSGGYEGGNDKAGGNVYISGGSIRTYIDANAVGAEVWADMGVTEAGVNDIAITAKKYCGDSDTEAHLLVFDTSMLNKSADTYTVEADGETIYKGGLHNYGYINESYGKSDQIQVQYTVDNWKYIDDSNLYLYLPAKNQTLKVNDETFDVKWNAESSTFTVKKVKLAGGSTVNKINSSNDEDTEVQQPVVIVGNGGKVTLSEDGTSATITPDSGYAVKSVLLNGKDKGVVTSLKGLKTGDTVAVTFEAASEKTNRFVDVNESDWFYSVVNSAAENGLMTGTSENTFSPKSYTTRGMLMTILARKAGVDTAQSSPWYQKGLDWAKEKGVSDGTNPEGYITRQQLAVMLYRAAGSPEVTGNLDAFTDKAEVSEYAENALIWAVDNGIMNGKGKGILDPTSNATRAEMAAMIMRYCEK